MVHVAAGKSAGCEDTAVALSDRSRSDKECGGEDDEGVDKHVVMAKFVVLKMMQAINKGWEKKDIHSVCAANILYLKQLSLKSQDAWLVWDG